MTAAQAQAVLVPFCGTLFQGRDPTSSSGRPTPTATPVTCLGQVSVYTTHASRATVLMRGGCP